MATLIGVVLAPPHNLLRRPCLDILPRNWSTKPRCAFRNWFCVSHLRRTIIAPLTIIVGRSISLPTPFPFADALPPAHPHLQAQSNTKSNDLGYQPLPQLVDLHQNKYSIQLHQFLLRSWLWIAMDVGTNWYSCEQQTLRISVVTAVNHYRSDCWGHSWGCFRQLHYT